jgi:ribosomal protein L28
MTLPETKSGRALSGVLEVRLDGVLREVVPGEPVEPGPRCAVASVPAHTVTNIMQMTNLRKRCAIAASHQKTHKTFKRNIRGRRNSTNEMVRLLVSAR